MKAKFVSSIPFKKNPSDLKGDYPIFGTLSWAYIANGLNNLMPDLFSEGKLELHRFYNFLRKTSPYDKGFDRMKDYLLQAAPLLGITKYLKLAKDERDQLKLQEKVYSGEYSLDYYENAEIPAEIAEDNDYVLRSMYGETEPAYYRFDKGLTDHEINMMKVAYIYRYGDPEKTPWKNYLDARPIKIKNIEKHGKSVDRTREFGD